MKQSSFKETNGKNDRFTTFLCKTVIFPFQFKAWPFYSIALSAKLCANNHFNLTEWTRYVEIVGRPNFATLQTRIHFWGQF
jgi:hypothetical protein